MKSLLKTGLLAILFGICPVQAQEANNSTTILFDSLIYDRFDRPVKGITPEGCVTETEYAGHKVTVRVGATWKTTEYSPKEVMTSVTDPSGTVHYFTRADGNPEKTIAPGNIETVFHYDKYGRPTGQTDPSFGTNHIEYDNCGNVIKETDADGRTFSATYDRFNRIVSSITAEDTVTYTYLRNGNVASIRSSNGSGTEYTYDTSSRIRRQRQYDGSQFFLREITYGDESEVVRITDTSDRGRLGEETFARSLGKVVEKFWNGTSVYRLDEVNALGHTTSATIGGGLRTYEYSKTGIPVRRATAGVMDISYDFDRLTGHLLSQTDNLKKKTNTYTYDNLKRLTSYGDTTAGSVHTMTYDPNGNILAKSDISGAYRYETPGKPYAVSHIKQASPVKDLDLIYSSIKRPLEIKGRDCRIAFKYNPGNDRVRMSTYAPAADSTETLLSVRTYFGSYECDSSAAGVTERLYLGGDPYSAPLIFLKRERQEDVYAVSRDFLGSVIAIADSSGRVVESRTYDPWGRMTREAADSALCITSRGYTSHEHIEEIGLINMNARLYDPLIGRFFSPDPKMMDGETQALNRYSYAMNNPFAYTDPSGEFATLAAVIVGAVVGAVAAGAATAATLAKSGASASEMAWKIPVATIIGGVAGALGGGIGGAMYAAGGVALAALSGVASTAATSLVGSTASFLTGSNTLSIGLLYYNFNTRKLENPFGSVQQSIFSALDIAGMLLPFFSSLSELKELSRLPYLSYSDEFFPPFENPGVQIFTLAEGESIPFPKGQSSKLAAIPSSMKSIEFSPSMSPSGFATERVPLPVNSNDNFIRMLLEPERRIQTYHDPMFAVEHYFEEDYIRPIHATLRAERGNKPMPGSPQWIAMDRFMQRMEEQIAELYPTDLARHNAYLDLLVARDNIEGHFVNFDYSQIQTLDRLVTLNRATDWNHVRKVMGHFYDPRGRYGVPNAYPKSFEEDYLIHHKEIP
ncbi:Cell wall-associated polypeptide CWBP200 [Bacteroidales bacterium Barb6XT]|nr:Cell wall-associated polypeptide CWBP200 [Bacteroidales bacterium Barb6XT]